MIRRPPRSTLDRSSAASDVYKRQAYGNGSPAGYFELHRQPGDTVEIAYFGLAPRFIAVSYTHLRAHETVLDLVCRLLLEKKNNKITIDHNGMTK